MLDHWVDDAHRLHIVMEYAANNDLCDFVARRQAAGTWGVHVAVQLMVDMAKGLDHVHAQRVLHRDIKPPNVLVSGDGRAMLGDFGLAKVMEAEMAVGGYRFGTVMYLAPELLPLMLAQSGASVYYAAAADIWALACTFHALLVGLPASAVQQHAAVHENIEWLPFWQVGDADFQQAWQRLQRCELDFSRLPAGTPPALLALLRSMFSRVPAERPTAEEVLGRLIIIKYDMARAASRIACSGLCIDGNPPAWCRRGSDGIAHIQHAFHRARPAGAQWFVGSTCPCWHAARCFSKGRVCQRPGTAGGRGCGSPHIRGGLCSCGRRGHKVGPHCPGRCLGCLVH